MEISRLFGLPAHPLLVHIPVVLVPLAALGALLAVLRPGWRARFGVLVVVVAGVALVGTQLAIGSGEELEEHVKETAAVEHHASVADTTVLWVLPFFLAVTALVVYDHRRQRRVVERTERPSPRRRSPVLAALTVVVLVTSAGATASVVRAGHTGASAVWERTEGGTGRR